MLHQPPELHHGDRQRRQSAVITFSLAALQRRRLTFHRAALTLARTGIIVIQAAAAPHDLRRVSALAHTTWDQVAALPPGGQHPTALLNRDRQRVLKGYKAFEGSGKAVINLRHGDDEGMMDIFHPERLDPSLKPSITNCLQEDLVADLAGLAFLRRLAVSCRNLYINRGVANTRFFHCDGEGVKVKAFVYLSPVHDLDQGPYCYVLGSHRNRGLRRRNQAFNRSHRLNLHEYRQLRGQAALPLFCQPGDMVISAQNGVHRGHPQAAGASRTVLVSVLKPR